MEAKIDVLLGLPDYIKDGLKTGIYKRYGGSIRNQQGQFVIHLRESGLEELESISKALPALKEQLNLLNLSGKIGTATNVLNLSISTISFIYLSKKIHNIEKKTEIIDYKLDVIIDNTNKANEKLDVFLMSNLKTATRLAERARVVKDKEKSTEDFTEARKLFSISRTNFQLILECMIKKQDVLTSIEAFSYYHTLYLASSLGEIKCSLYLENLEAALYDLNSLKEFNHQIKCDFKNNINPLNPDFITTQLNKIQLFKEQLLENNARLWSIAEEIKMLEKTKTPYIEWENIGLENDQKPGLIFIKFKEAS